MTNRLNWAAQLVAMVGADKKNIIPLADWNLASQMAWLQVLHKKKKWSELPLHDRNIYVDWPDWNIFEESIIEYYRNEDGSVKSQEILTLDEGFKSIEHWGRIAHTPGIGNIETSTI